MTARPRKILIVLHGAIGDVVRAMPLAVRIKRSWPESRISWAVEPRSLPILEGHPAVDQAIVFNRPEGFPAYLKFVRELRRERFDLVLDLQRHFKSGVTSRATGAKTRLGFHRRNAKEFNWLFNNRHIESVPNFSAKIGHYQKFGDELGLEPLEPLEFDLRPTAEESEHVRSLIAAGLPGGKKGGGQRYAAMVLGSTWPSRFWTVEAYCEVISELYSRHGIVSFLVGSAPEAEFADKLMSALGDVPVLDLVQKTTLHELTAVFSESAVVVGSDSGPMHIAAAVGAPVVSLWGSTTPKRSAPYGSEHLALQSGIGCSPCYKRSCPGLDTICMKGVSPEAVLAELEKLPAISA